jgi:hypothetical protein
MSRAWTWIDEDLERTDEAIDRITPLLDQLAYQWSNLHDAEEQRGFARQADYEDGRDDSDFEDEAEEFAARQMAQLRYQQHEAQLSAIEEMMAAHGARMMRPYEHWNEDERYMQYMECDRYGDSCY